MIKFTIITITYNAEAVVQRTLDSVLAQDYPLIEHIIVDGASKDGTLNVANKYKEESDRQTAGRSVVVKSEPDGGIYDAMNKGLKLATGDYVCFLNAGDFLPDSLTLTTIATNARLNETEDEGGQLPAVVYGETDLVDNNGQFLRHRRLSAPERLTWKSFREGMLVCHQAFYARTDIAKQEDYDLNYRHSADVDWCIRVMKRAAQQRLQLVNVHAVIAYYQAEGDSTVNHRASLMERFSVMRRHYGLPLTLLMHAWFIVRSFIKK